MCVKSLCTDCCCAPRFDTNCCSQLLCVTVIEACSYFVSFRCVSNTEVPALYCKHFWKDFVPTVHPIVKCFLANCSGMELWVHAFFVTLGKNANFYRRIWLYSNCKGKQTEIKWPAFCINRGFLKSKTICSNDLHLRWDLGHAQNFKYLFPSIRPFYALWHPWAFL